MGVVGVVDGEVVVDGGGVDVIVVVVDVVVVVVVVVVGANPRGQHTRENTTPTRE